MVVFLQSGCIRVRLLVFKQKWLYSDKLVFSGKIGFIPEGWLSSGKSGCIRAKVVVFGPKCLYSGKSGSIRANMVVFGKKKWM